MTEQEEMPSGCAMRDWSWILGTISSPKVQSGIGTGCPGHAGVTTSGSVQNVWMWHLGTRFYGEHSGAGGWLGSMISEVFCNPKDPMTGSNGKPHLGSLPSSWFCASETIGVCSGEAETWSPPVPASCSRSSLTQPGVWIPSSPATDPGLGLARWAQTFYQDL